MISIPAEGPSGQMGRRFAMVPRADFQVLDNWHAVGLRGSGSSDIVAKDIFIPDYRTIDFGEIDRIDSPGTKVNPGPTYRLNTFLVFNLTGVGPALGCAKSAFDAFTDGMKQRRNVLGSKIPELQNIQMRTSEAGAEISAAEALIEKQVATLRAAANADGKVERGALLQLQRDCAYIGRLCQSAVARIAESQGAHGLFEDNLVNMAQADLRGVCAHMTMGWDANCVPWGKHALGIAHVGLI
jgi:3-hydroxy-9,10-secoandrosta-1,3,5(10)-triene-9,17-dione monooxygenase